MLRTILIYGLLLAALAGALQWLEFQYLVRTYATETYVVLVAVGFLVLGIWAGSRLFSRPPSGEFVENTRVQETLGITFIEMFPVGLLVSLISAAVLRNSRVLPARA
jgi:ABC-type uncharacterized transport system permease subunit